LKVFLWVAMVCLLKKVLRVIVRAA
jgi:hypothetical protein